MNERKMFEGLSAETFEEPSMSLDGYYSVFATTHRNRRARKIGEVYSRGTAVAMLGSEFLIGGYVLDENQNLIAHKGINNLGSVAII